MNIFENLVDEMRAAQRAVKSNATLQNIRRAAALEADVDREIKAIKKAEAGKQPAAFTADLFQVEAKK